MGRCVYEHMHVHDVCMIRDMQTPHMGLGRERARKTNIKCVEDRRVGERERE